LLKEGSDGGRVHAAHSLEFSGFLAVQEVAVGIEYGESGDAALEGDIVLGGEVGVVVVVADVDVDEDVVGVEERMVGQLAEIEVEDLAVATPVAAEVEDDTLMFAGGGREGVADLGVGVGGFVVDVARMELLLSEGWGDGECDEESEYGSGFRSHGGWIQCWESGSPN
jgi:hypothetical protein